jgi:carbamoyl-phosphate synthase large subunit
MKSTGEVMGVGKTFGEAFLKAQVAAGEKLPVSGKVFLTVKNSDKPTAIKLPGSSGKWGLTWWLHGARPRPLSRLASTAPLSTRWSKAVRTS